MRRRSRPRRRARRTRGPRRRGRSEAAAVAARPRRLRWTAPRRLGALLGLVCGAARGRPSGSSSPLAARTSATTTPATRSRPSAARGAARRREPAEAARLRGARRRRLGLRGVGVGGGAGGGGQPARPSARAAARGARARAIGGLELVDERGRGDRAVGRLRREAALQRRRRRPAARRARARAGRARPASAGRAPRARRARGTRGARRASRTRPRPARTRRRPPSTGPASNCSGAMYAAVPDDAAGARDPAHLVRGRDAEVGELDVAALVQQDVGGLDVAVHDAGRVRAVDRLGQRAQDRQRPVGRHPALLQRVGERAARDVLHDQQHGVVDRDRVEHRHEVRVRERRAHPRLAHARGGRSSLLGSAWTGLIATCRPSSSSSARWTLAIAPEPRWRTTR